MLEAKLHALRDMLRLQEEMRQENARRRREIEAELAKCMAWHNAALTDALEAIFGSSTTVTAGRHPTISPEDWYDSCRVAEERSREITRRILFRGLPREPKDEL